MQLGIGELKILKAVAQYPEGVTRDQISVLTGYKRSTRNTYIQRLQAKHAVEIRGGRIITANTGYDILGDRHEPLPTGEELQEYWLQKLPQGERMILKVLLEAYPNSVNRDQITDETDYKRSTRNTYLQRMKAREIIFYTDNSSVQASHHLFD